MSFQKFLTRFQILLLAFMVATSFSQTSVAQTPKQMLALIKSSKILADKQPVASLSDRKLAKQRKTLTRFIRSPLGSPDLKRQASVRLAQINFETSRRQRAAAAPRKKVPGVVVNPARVPSVLRDRRPSASLPTRQLQSRIKVLRDIVVARRVNRRLLKRARTMRAADIAEMRQRRGAVAQRRLFAVLGDQRPSSDLATPQLRQRIKRLSNVIAATGSKPRLRNQARAMHARDMRELKRRSRGTISAQLVTMLNDTTRPGSLRNAQLKRRIARLGASLQSDRLTGQQRRSVKNLRRRYIAELDRRRAVAPQPARQRLAVLQDRRPAASLRTRELRARVNTLRDLLRSRAIARNVRLKVSQKLRFDRTELRRRVAERRARRAGRNVQPIMPNPPRVRMPDQARRLLSDGRTARALNRGQLNNRIKSVRKVLKFVALTAAQRASLRNMIARDRAEKRRRLLAARDRRRARLERLRSRGELRIDINPGFVPQPYDNYGNGDRRGDIAAAEADEGQIQRQFLEPGRRTYKRRYSREEIIRRPDLTRGFAGIDVDTINFGFNEYWIREEEIDQLERMAVTIERILAARPYEVFQIEGHTDAVGSDAYNLKLSRQRAQAVKEALTKFFVIPARALVTIGLGERYLKIPTPDAESENRRVTIRRITPIVAR